MGDQPSKSGQELDPRILEQLRAQLEQLEAIERAWQEQANKRQAVQPPAAPDVLVAPAPVEAARPQQQTTTISYVRSVRPMHDLHQVLGAMRMEVGKNLSSPEFKRAIGDFIREHNERVGKQEWPASGIGVLSEKSTPAQVLNAARNELVERLRPRVEPWKKNPDDASLTQALQRGLKALGFYEGEVNGKTNLAMRRGVEAFERNPSQPFSTSREVVLLTGHNYEGRKAPTRYIPDDQLAKFEMPKDSVTPHANKDGWVGFMVAQEWGVNERGASVAAGQIGFYNVNTGETRSFSMMTGGGSAKLSGKSANEWQRNAATPGMVQTDHVPNDPNVNYVAQVKEHRTSRLKKKGFGFFTHTSNPYAGKTRQDDIGIHVDVGKLGSHGCPNIQAKDKAAFLQMMTQAKVTNFVILAPEVAVGLQLQQAPQLQRQGNLSELMREQLAVLELSPVIGRGEAVQEAKQPQLALATTELRTEGRSNG